MGYRNGRIAGDFITGGGSINDVSARTDWFTRANVAVSGLLQVEWWSYPILSNGVQSNVAASIQVAYCPKLSLK